MRPNTTKQNGKVRILVNSFLSIHISLYVFSAINVFGAITKDYSWGVKDHCERESHKAMVAQVKRNKQISQSFFPAASSTSRDVVTAKVMVTNFLTQHSSALRILSRALTLFSQTARLLSRMPALQQKQQYLSAWPWVPTALSTKLSIASNTHSVWASMDLVTLKIRMFDINESLL